MITEKTTEKHFLKTEMWKITVKKMILHWRKKGVLTQKPLVNFMNNYKETARNTHASCM